MPVKVISGEFEAFVTISIIGLILKDCFLPRCQRYSTRNKITCCSVKNEEYPSCNGFIIVLNVPLL
jgi:hypothetical protein